MTAGTACGCTPFVGLYAADLAAAHHVVVKARNLGIAGETSAGLLASLESGSAADAVASADLITITIGANDFSYTHYSSIACPNLSCYAAGIEQLRSNLVAIITRIHSLRGARLTAIRLTDYWEVWEDGSVGRRQGAQYMAVGDELTRLVNKTIEGVATAMKVGFVDLYVPFRGAGGDRDDTSLLAEDGDHPDADGHALIAAALIATGVSPLAP